ncbi:putative nucleotide-diphospho-sugar transferase [Winogradskyella ouciana]|uniref:Nucleotide-diphospho-sugar transferase domain-containing protein n=1 Tax=Winogradskyella ouciana TaxID=2608631 RepID=A0A7K1GDL5_9FLAO|nr:putative nucleotide-diphospho-sugar transferase [Winogradskyella ouciana]MTE26534.1 hypothetical protein [Winogradskyella ouciana]
MTLVTSLYGNKYASLLMVFLESLESTGNTSKIIVFWSDIDKEIFNPIANHYSYVRFIEVKPQKTLDRSSNTAYLSSLKSGKMQYLNNIYEFLENDEDFVLIDCDTIINNDLKSIYNNNFDVAYTPMDIPGYHYPVNIGILCFRNNAKTKALTQRMEEHVIHLSKNEDLHKLSVLKYGAADQAAFCRIINYKSDDHIDNDMMLSNLKTLQLDASVYNNFNNQIDVDKVSVIHLKGSWQTLIFKGRAITSIESKGLKALPVYKSFIGIFLKSYFKVFNDSNTKRLQNKLNVKIPFYLRKKEDQITSHKTLLAIYNSIERLYRFAYNKNLKIVFKPMQLILFRDYRFWLK